MFERISKKSVCERVIDQIKGSIANGELKPGDKLPSERTLAELFSVSRGTVREALRVLQYVGILEVRINDGTYLSTNINLVADQVRTSYLLKQFTFIELLEARKVLETAIAGFAAERITEEQLGNLETIYEEERHRRSDIQSFIRADVAFHMALADACQNSFFREMIEPVRELLEESNRRQYEKSEQIETTLVYHRRILDAMKKKDPEKASSVMSSYLENIVHTTTEIYRNEMQEQKQIPESGRKGDYGEYFPER
jgi:GntR family transcriptional repressor for pyruvate dehydrogenase complex